MRRIGAAVAVAVALLVGVPSVAWAATADGWSVGAGTAGSGAWTLGAPVISGGAVTGFTGSICAGSSYAALVIATADFSSQASWSGTGCPSGSRSLTAPVSTSTVLTAYVDAPGTGGYVAVATWTYAAPAPASPASTCAASVSSAQAAYIGGVLSVRFRTSTVPSGGWKLFGLSGADRVAGTAALGTVTTTQITDFPGWYGLDVTTSATPLAFVRIQRASDPGCWQSSAVSTSTPVTIDAPDTGTGEDGSSCGLNPFCHVKSALSWAFIPDDASLDRISSVGDGIQEVIPFCYVADALDVFGQLTTGADGDNSGTTSNSAGLANFRGFRVNVPFTSTDLVAFGPGSDSAEFLRSGNIRGLLAIALWLAVLVPLVSFIFRRSLPAVGGEGA